MTAYVFSSPAALLGFVVRLHNKKIGAHFEITFLTLIHCSFSRNDTHTSPKLKPNGFETHTNPSTQQIQVNERLS
jgi:hypothetical protein